MDGFLIVLDKEANILYVSETITGYVGLSQVSIEPLCNQSFMLSVIIMAWAV